MNKDCYCCGAVFDVPPDQTFCPGCLTPGSLRPLALRTATATLPRRPRAGVKTSLEVRRERLSPAPWPEEIVRVIGRAPERFDCLVFGSAGQGKSSFATAIADRAARPGRRVLYAAVEEGQSEALVQRLGRLEVVNSDLLIGTGASWSEVVQDLDENLPVALVVIDSYSALFPAPDLSLVAGDLDARKIASILVVHTNKGGAFAGPARLAHDVDVVVQVENLRFAVRKNRFGALASGTVDLAEIGVP